MKILILGGTIFLGRALVEAALARGHEVTLFNRGKSNPDLFPEVEKLRGDRDGNLEALQGRRWDAVIDTAGYFPRLVGQTATLLADAVEHYTFISSVSVYADGTLVGSAENAPLVTLEDDTVEEVTGETYGGLKVLCEQVVEKHMPGKTLILRPGLIVGPHDQSDRFSYWPHRVAQNGIILAPGLPERPIQIIDVRDLAEWNIRLIESKQTGSFNAAGPKEKVTMGTFLDRCQQTCESEVSFQWVSDEFLLAQEVAPWMDLPLWLPENNPNFAWMFSINFDKALAAGLTFRPLAETIQATLEWVNSRPDGYTWRAGILRQREHDILELWEEYESMLATI